MSAQVRWCWTSCRELACDDGVEVGGDGGDAFSATHQHEAASSPNGSRLLRAGFTSRDSWESTRCVRYFILILLGEDQLLLANKMPSQSERYKNPSFLLFHH